MAIFNLGNDVANEREINQTAAHMEANLIPQEGMRRFGSLININPYAQK